MKKRNVYLITYHKALSYGAFLQAFALQYTFKKKNIENKIIDFVPARFSFKNYIFGYEGNIITKIFKVIIGFIPKTRMYLTINRIANKSLILTERKFLDSTGLKEFFSNSDDVFVVGSDQVWDLRYDNAVSNSLAYYLSFCNSSRYSYSSSCGEMDFLKKNCFGINDVCNELQKFKCITVREEKHAFELNKLLKREDIQMMIDPTLLLTGDEWSQYCSFVRTPNQYVLVYDLYRNVDIKRYAFKLAKRYNLKIVNICDFLNINPKARNIFNVNPYKLLYLIKNAEHVVTNSFHGCAFSINFNKKLHIFRSKTSNERIENLVNIFELQKNFVIDIEKTLPGCINYDFVNKKLKLYRNKASSYIDLIKKNENL